MHKIDAVEYLVNKESDVLFGENIFRLDNVGQVVLHELHNDVCMVECFLVLNMHNIEQRYDVFMIEKLYVD